jgi:hypothetical protein
MAFIFAPRAFANKWDSCQLNMAEKQGIRAQQQQQRRIAGCPFYALTILGGQPGYQEPSRHSSEGKYSL